MTSPTLGPIRSCLNSSAKRLGTFLLALAVAGCGNLTAGGATGQAVVVVSGDAPEPTPVPVTTVPTASFSAVPGQSDHDDTPEGQLEVELLLTLVSENGVALLLSDDVIEVQVDLEGVEEDEVANQLVEAGLYTELRLLFTKIEAEVDAGLVIGGVEVTGPIEVDLDGPLVVSRTLSLEVMADQRAVLLVDLNAASWLQAVDPVTGIVDAQVFADLIAISIR